ncbi:MAG: NAD(P)/FAD-dependent oxidoreductase [Anaerolineae bacterium]|nr:NAD(P)/FAD-dependent oxidoreductase [Anaerolineae bacterium]
MQKRVVVIGAGAAGLMAAGRAAEVGADVVLLEKMREAGQKILVSGKERCNITNSAPLEKFLKYYGRNGQFLRNAYHRFFRDELLALLARYGVQTEVERGGRIFPSSGQAADVRNALLRYVTSQGVQMRYLVEAQRLLVAGGVIQGVLLRSGEQILSDAVILATGGASWPATGSTGEGYQMAQAVGHTLVPLRPALVPLTVAERAQAQALQGVSLRNARCTFLVSDVCVGADKQGKEKVLKPEVPLPPTGEMLFTHFGVSGPLILSASLTVVDALRAGKRVWLSIDLKPGMTEQEVHARLQREFETLSHRHLRRLLKGWVPTKLADLLDKLSGVDPDQHVHGIRAEQRERIVGLLKNFRWEITGSLPLASAMVTAGGVALNEVDPLSFESKKVPGLHIVGEVLDLAADTGGFNLQAAFTSGYLAGTHAAQ